MGVNKECEVSHQLEIFTSSSKTGMLAGACLKPRAQGPAASTPCPQHVVTYSAWWLLDGIFCEDPVVEEAVMPPSPS